MAKCSWGYLHYPRFSVKIGLRHEGILGLLSGSNFSFMPHMSLKGYSRALARWLSWLEHHSVHQKIVGLILVQGVWEATD